MSQDEDQALDAAWRRASAEEAGRPSAKTRAAILAEAAAAARRRQPAANESRYWLSAVAGVAVIGIGVLLWRQTDMRLPGEPPEMVLTQQDLASAAPAEDAAAPQAFPEAPAPPPAFEAAESLRPAPAPVPEIQRRPDEALPQVRGQVANAGVTRDSAAGAGGLADESSQGAALTREASPAQAPPAPPPPPPAAAVEKSTEAGEREELEEVMITGSRILRSDRPPVGPRPGVSAPVRRQPPAPDPGELLRSQFPVQYQSSTPHRLWVVLDAGGEVLRSGELAPSELLEAVAVRLQRDLGSQPGPWRVERMTNARGQAIELGISRVP